ncbi:MAG: glycogen synthase [Flavobacteriales bacterium]|nr:glycogen synthase [Flavobacteriales bacterium]|tara:strand:+ start:3402 stop:4220 length:819 start_codon:yes stop_codon:yes gene_type:complete
MKKRVLFINQEMLPYIEESEIAKIGRNLPQGIQQKGKEIRTFMPRFGCINERRNQLHEVIRLSGMNLIIDDNDHPLIIKVASIQAARMQVYFIDNEEYFQRKFGLKDKAGNFFEDNDERAIFYCRGVLETVKKLGWAPDVIHCHGWMNAFVPLYIKKVFNEDPIFAHSKVIFSVYNTGFEGELNKNFGNKAILDGVDLQDVADLEKPTAHEVYKHAVKWSDGVILGSENIDSSLVDFINESNKPTLEFQKEETYVEEYNNFYDSVLALEEAK